MSAPTHTDPDSLAIVRYPAQVLRTKATKLEPTPEVIAVAQQMIKLMHDAPGIGLAAPQVGLSWRLFVADVSPDDERSELQTDPNGPAEATEGPQVYINPVISKPQGLKELSEEGCLSLPGVFADILRPPIVTITYTDLAGQRITQRAAGLLARCWQHETDHLDGVLILDRMSKPDRLRIKSKLEKLEKAAQK